MCTPSSTGLIAMPVSSESTTYQTALRTDWMLAFGTETLRGVVHAVGSSNLEVRMEYITASVLGTDPNAVSSLAGSPLAANGYLTNSVSLPSTAKDNLVQVVAQIRSDTAGTLAQGLVSLQAWGDTASKIIATRTLELGPTEIVSGTKNYNYLPLAAPMPIVGLSQIMYAVVYPSARARSTTSLSTAPSPTTSTSPNSGPSSAEPASRPAPATWSPDPTPGPDRPFARRCRPTLSAGAGACPHYSRDATP